jgi:plastocyanin
VVLSATTVYRFFDAVRKPAAILAALAALAACGTTWALAGELAIRVVANDGSPMAGAVVEIHNLTSQLRPPAPIDTRMDQVDLAFAPGVLVVPVGSRIAFPNSDVVSHQVYSFSPAKRFQLPLYRGKPYPPITFDVPGLVTVGCNIHDNMLGYVFVTDAPYYGQTSAAGAWSSAALPPGDYAVSIWHPRLRNLARPLTQNVSVSPADAHNEFVFRIDEPLRPQRLTAKRTAGDSY